MKESRVELKRPIAVLHHVLVQLQLAVTESSVAETPTLTSKFRLRKIEQQQGLELEKFDGELKLN